MFQQNQNKTIHRDEHILNSIPPAPASSSSSNSSNNFNTRTNVNSLSLYDFYPTKNTVASTNANANNRLNEALSSESLYNYASNATQIQSPMHNRSRSNDCLNINVNYHSSRKIDYVQRPNAGFSAHTDKFNVTSSSLPCSPQQTTLASPDTSSIIRSRTPPQPNSYIYAVVKQQQSTSNSPFQSPVIPTLLPISELENGSSSNNRQPDRISLGNGSNIMIKDIDFDSLLLASHDHIKQPASKSYDSLNLTNNNSVSTDILSNDSIDPQTSTAVNDCQFYLTQAQDLQNTVERYEICWPTFNQQAGTPAVM
eukprot:Awhi_evm1s15527